MRLSIWQQFSSNHSARFTVVGVFKSVEAASHAAGLLESTRLAANEWLAMPENAEAAELLRDGGYLVSPTPPEQALAASVGMEFEHSRVWDVIPVREASPYSSVDKVVIINGWESSFGAQPFDQLLRRMGADVYVEGSLDPEASVAFLVSLTITCTAPDETIARQIAEEYRNSPHDHVRQDGTNLAFVDFDFYRVGIVNQLRARGCTDIHYEFKQEQDED